MKYLEYPPLTRLSSFLSHVNVGDCIVQGDLEAYSCKLAGVDKKLSRSLDQEVVNELSISPSHLARSPVGPLAEASSRKTLIYLILTLNHMYPDYDFSTLRAEHFSKKVWSGQGMGGTPTSSLGGGGKFGLGNTCNPYASAPASFSEELWSIVDEMIMLNDCDVYSYLSDPGGTADAESADPFSERGCLWSFNYFFYNRRLKRILYFSCRSVSKSARGSYASRLKTESYSDEEDVSDRTREGEEFDIRESSEDDMFLHDEDMNERD